MIVEPNAKLSHEGSPSAKGSLSNYLVSSPNENRPLSTLPTTCGSSDRQDQVRRNLSLDIESSDSVHGVENPELQQFAANFLSVYCRYVCYFLVVTFFNCHRSIDYIKMARHLLFR